MKHSLKAPSIKHEKRVVNPKKKGVLFKAPNPYLGHAYLEFDSCEQGETHGVTSAMDLSVADYNS